MGCDWLFTKCCHGYRNTALTTSNTVDLHGLHVDEAMDVLKRIIAERESGMNFGEFLRLALSEF